MRPGRGGVARPRAHGLEATKLGTELRSAQLQLCSSLPVTMVWHIRLWVFFCFVCFVLLILFYVQSV